LDLILILIIFISVLQQHCTVVFPPGVLEKNVFSLAILPSTLSSHTIMSQLESSQTSGSSMDSVVEMFIRTRFFGGDIAILFSQAPYKWVSYFRALDASQKMSQVVFLVFTNCTGLNLNYLNDLPLFLNAGYLSLAYISASAF
jgi:hypothetical protein